MGLIKKVAAVGTLGVSVAAEKALKAGAGIVRARGRNVTPEEAANGVIFVGTSHEEGRNATVTLYKDRIERLKERSRLSVSKAHQDVEVTPLKAVSSVQSEKDGITFTKVKIFASGNNISFRFAHDDAHDFREAITELLLAAGGSAAVPQVHAPPDAADQIRKFAELRDAGILTEAEFEAKKAELLSGM